MALGSMDYSPLLGITNFTKQQVLWLGGLSLGKGIFTEIARRRHMMEETLEVK